MAKQGEIAIVRGNQVKAAKEFERQLQALQKAQMDDAARYRKEIEQAKAEAKKVATDNRFLQQDLTEEGRRIKALQRDLKGKGNIVGPTTPKKKQLPFRDGFDDDEMVALSPTKSGGRRGTPSRAKRKRKVTEDSPIPIPLELSSPGDGRYLPEEEHVPLATEGQIAENGSTRLLESLQDQKSNHSIRFLQKVLNHRSSGNRERTLETLTKFAFPSAPDVLLSSVTLERLARIGHGQSVESYPAEICRIAVYLWRRALEEKYYAPVAILTELVAFIISLDPSATAPYLIEPILSTAQFHGEVNGIPRMRHSPQSNVNMYRPDRGQPTPQSKLCPLIDSTMGLSILYATATACLHSRDSSIVRHFWTAFRQDFILIMLNSHQPLADLSLMVHLLSTSIFEDSFSTLQNLDFTPSPGQSKPGQKDREHHVLDRLSALLFETPQPDEGIAPNDPLDVLNLRADILSLFHDLMLTSNGVALLATHATTISRLTRLIHDAHESLYHNVPSTQAAAAHLVNAGIRILHYLLTTQGDSIDLQAKLSTKTPAAPQKYLVVLTRLAFGEGILLEEGIEEETVDMAHELLEAGVTPEEGELLMDAFPSARSSAR